MPSAAERNREKQRRYYALHREQVLERVNAYRLENKDAVRETKRKRRQRDKAAGIKHKQSTATNRRGRLATYGLTPADYERMFSDQGGCCALCHQPPRQGKNMHVDHDHKTGKVRALLCHSCNISLGRFGDDIERLKMAIDYLQHHQGSSLVLTEKGA